MKSMIFYMGDFFSLASLRELLTIKEFGKVLIFISLLFNCCFMGGSLGAADSATSQPGSLFMAIGDKAKGIWKGVKENAQENPTPYYVGGVVAVGTGAAVGTGLAVSHFLNKKLSQSKRDNEENKKEQVLLNAKLSQLKEKKKLLKQKVSTTIYGALKRGNPEELEEILKDLHPGILNGVKFRFKKNDKGEFIETDNNSKKGANYTPLEYAMIDPNSELFTLLLEKGGRPSSDSPEGKEDSLNFEERDKERLLSLHAEIKKDLEQKALEQKASKKVNKKREELEKIEKLIHQGLPPQKRKQISPDGRGRNE